MDNLIGQTIFNRFRVDAFIASGGNSQVYRVWDVERNSSLVMKVLQTKPAGDSAARDRLQRQSLVLQRLVEPHIASYYGFYQTPEFSFLLEEFIEGTTLRDFLNQRLGQPLPAQEALIYLKALCSALDYAHKNGIVHGDVRPSNVIIDPGGNISLTDFGFARPIASTTNDLGVIPSPTYMAPEQIRGGPASPATDIYALGVLLFELLTGRRPFGGDDTVSRQPGSVAGERVRQAHLTLPPPNPHDLNPSILQALGFVVIRALAKKPEERYPGAMALFEAACDALGMAPNFIQERVPLVSTPQTVMPTERIARPVQAIEQEAEIESEPLHKRPAWIWVLAGVISLGCLLLVGIFLGARLPVVIAALRRTPAPTQTLISTTAPTNVPTAVPSLAPAATHTSLPTLAPLPTKPPELPTPVPTPLPQPTEQPTIPPAPTQPPAPTTFIVRVYNRFSYQINVWLDDRKYNTAQINPNLYIGFFNISGGEHVVHYCRTDGTNCGDKTIVVDSNSSSYDKAKGAFIVSVP